MVEMNCETDYVAKNENFKSKFFYDRTCMAGVKDMGDLYYDCKDAETWNCSSGQAYWKYIELYDVTGKNNNYFMLNFPLGSFDVNGLNRTYTIKPLFYEYPGEIVLGKPGQ